ncbi:MAG TPA: DNA mismatch repair protein MutL, partial [Thermoanaerobaculia bacterium]|nr:DNA mismatch repair protein MutL [Thermoanaerobaculia bacterium]
RAPVETLRAALAALADASASDEALRRDRLAASLACRSAVTIRYHLAAEEIRHLLSDWAKTLDRFTCPHGRPVVLSLSEVDLEKHFKRR